MKLAQTSASAIVCLVAMVYQCSVAHAAEHVLIVGGIGGDEQYAESFRNTVEQLTAVYSSPGENVTHMHSDAVSRTSVLDAITTIAEKSSNEDSLILMFVGHGSYDGENYKFNIPGQDLTGDDLKTALSGVSAEKQLVVLATSASGVMLKTLESPGRILVTATKSGGEINAVAFPLYWADALSNGAADYDRNEIITAQEAFRYATVQVEAHYKDRNLLASEHSRIVGNNSRRFAVAQIGSLRDAIDNPKVIALLEDRRSIETEILKLREDKSVLSQDDYFKELEELLLKMARLQLVIDQETGWRPADG